MALPVFKSSANNGSPVSSATQSVTVPSAALAPAAGDVILLATGSATGPGTTVTFPAGFVELTPTPGAPGYQSRVAWKTSDGTEGGLVLTITATGASKRTLLVAIYSGVSATPIAAQASAAQASSSTIHTTPALTTSAADQLEVAVAMDATGAGATQMTAWTFPAPLIKRTTVITSAAAGASSLSLADSDTNPNAVGAALGGRAATSDAIAVGTTWTVLLAPGTVGAAPLTATLAITPTSGTVPLAVTATASTTGGTGTAKSYAWVWGDGATTAAQAGVSATHSYTTAGAYTVTVTVTASGSTAATATASVQANAAVTQFLYVRSGTTLVRARLGMRTGTTVTYLSP